MVEALTVQFQLEVYEMKAWILAAVLAVVVLGGAVVAVASDGDTASDYTVDVDMLDIDQALVAPTLDAALAYERIENTIFDRLSEVPVFASIFANTADNFPIHALADSSKHRLSSHLGKPVARATRTNYEDHPVRLARFDRSHPLRC